MNHLHSIMKIAKVMKILSAIGKFLCIICACFSIVAIVGCCVLYANEDLVNGFILDPQFSESLEQVFMEIGLTSVSVSDLTLTAEFLLDNVIALLAQAFLFSLVSFVLQKQSYLYFKHLYDAQTPFTYEGAEELRKLGWHEIEYNIGALIATSVLQSILSVVFGDLIPIFSASAFAVVPALGIFYLVLSLVFRYGAFVEKKANGSDVNL